MGQLVCKSMNMWNPLLEGRKMLKSILRHTLTIPEAMHASFRLGVVRLALILSNDVVEHHTEGVIRERFGCGILTEKDIVCEAEAEGREIAKLNE
jgi:hypothetical protein